MGRRVGEEEAGERVEWRRRVGGTKGGEGGEGKVALSAGAETARGMLMFSAIAVRVLALSSATSCSFIFCSSLFSGVCFVVAALVPPEFVSVIVEGAFCARACRTSGPRHWWRRGPS